MEGFIPSKSTKGPEKASVSLAGIKPIEEGGSEILSREDIGKVVELPLIEACEEFYDKNIETWQSSANQKDIERGEVYVIIVYDTLSEENKAIAEQFGAPYQYNHTQLIKLSLPVTADSTIADIQSGMHSMVEKFKSQPMMWARSFSLKEASEMYGTDPENLKDVEGWYYDEPNDRLYMSKEHYDKATSSKI